LADISNEPNSVTLVIVQGAPLSVPVTITDASTDFSTGWAGRCRIVDSFTSNVTVIDLTVTPSAAANGSIVMTLSLTAVQTAGLTNTAVGDRQQSIGQYTFEIYKATDIRRMMQGAAKLSRGKAS
jgi:hypothetical protein